MIFALSDTVQLAIATGIFALVTIIVNGVLAILMLWLKEKFDREREAARMKLVVGVKEDLAATTTDTSKRFDGVDEKLGEVHELVNGLAKEKARLAGNAGFDAGESGKPNPTTQ
jgi:hypothetical protein